MDTPITTTDTVKADAPIIPQRTVQEPRDTTIRAPETAAPVTNTETPKEDKAPVVSKTYTQEDLDRITESVRKNAERRTKREVAAYYEGQASALKTAEPKKEEPKPDKMPVRDDFQDWDSFSEAKADWVARKAVREENERIVKERKERETVESRAKRMDEFRTKTAAKFPDIHTRIEAIGDVELSSEVADAIAESDYGPEIMNHFIDNRKDLERISKLPTSAAARELGRLEARFESAAKKPEGEPAPKTSAAPAPITPVSGGKTAASTSELSDKDPIDVWMKKRNAQDAAKRGLTV